MLNHGQNIESSLLAAEKNKNVMHTYAQIFHVSLILV